MSTRQIGRKLVQWGVAFFKTLDPSTHEVVGSGQGKNKSDQQLPGLSVAIEWKNQNSFNMGGWIDDLKTEQGIANEMVILGFRDPRSPEGNPQVYFVVSSDDMYRLLESKKNQLPATSRIPKYEVERLREMLRRVSKYLE